MYFTNSFPMALLKPSFAFPGIQSKSPFSSSSSFFLPLIVADPIAITMMKSMNIPMNRGM
jgi:hypothetical protein